MTRMDNNSTYQDFIKAHVVAVDYRENKDGKCETVPMVSVETAMKACQLAMKEVEDKYLTHKNKKT